MVIVGHFGYFYKFSGCRFNQYWLHNTNARYSYFLRESTFGYGLQSLHGIIELFHNNTTIWLSFSHSGIWRGLMNWDWFLTHKAIMFNYFLTTEKRQALASPYLIRAGHFIQHKRKIISKEWPIPIRLWVQKTCRQHVPFG